MILDLGALGLGWSKAGAIAVAKIGPLCVLFVSPRPLKGSTWQKILIFFEVFARLGCAQFCQLF